MLEQLANDKITRTFYDIQLQKE